MAEHVVKCRIVFINEKALRALAVAAECTADIAEDMPWRDDAQRAVKALKYAAKHITVVPDERV